MAKTKILIVAEQAKTAKQSAAALQRLGYKVAGPCESMSQARLDLKKKRPDILLVELTLTQWQSTVQAGMEINAEIPVIYLIAEKNKRVLKTTQLKPQLDYLTLPCKDHELFFAIETALRQHITPTEPAVDRTPLDSYFKQFLDLAPVAFLVIDNKNLIRFANLYTNELLGYNPSELLGQNVEILVPARFQSRHAIDVSEYFNQPHKREMDAGLNIVCLRADGREVPVDIGLNPVKVQGQDFVLACIADISKRKQFEENLRQAEIKYRTLVEQVPPIIYIAAPDQHVGVTYISPRIKQLGFEPKEWIAEPRLWLEQMHPDDRARVLLEVEESARNNQPFSSEYRLISRDGQVRWFLDEVLDIVDNDGKLMYRQGFMLDITARKLAEESLAGREQYSELLNKMTRTILLASDFNSLFQTLAFDMKKILDADDCYLLRWDAGQELPIPMTTTAKLDFDFAKATAEENQVKITTSVLQIGHALAVEDTLNSPYIAEEIARQFPARSIVGVPLLASGHKLGIAIIAFNSPHQFTQVELEQAEQAGNQVALALWDFQQSSEIQHRLRTTDALARIARALSESERVGSGEVLQLIVDSARELMPNAEKSVIHLLDVEAQVLIAQAVSGYGEAEKEGPRVNMRLGEGVAGSVIREGITVNIGDITTHPNFIIGDSLPSFRSMLVAPVQSGHQQIGTISIQSKHKNAFSKQDADLLYSLGLQASVAIENTRLFETTQKRLKEVNALYQISRRLAASLEADQLINETVSLIQQTFNYYHVQIYLLEPETGNLVVRHGSGYIGTQLVEQHFSLPAGEGIVGHVAETGEPFITNNVDGVVFFKRNSLLPDTQTEVAVPIKVDQKVLGVLDIQNTLASRFTDDDFLLMIAVADHLAVALQRASLYSNLQSALRQEQTIRSQLVQSERLALVGRLLASVSHELNNPLQAIQNALFLLKDEENLSAQGKQDLEIILSEAERMAALIERLRSAYRPIRIRDFEPVQINNTVEDVYALIATLMRHKEIAFEFLPDADLPPVPGISDQLRQVILNLFLNAAEIMQPGGHLTVQTCNLPEQNEILITVKDTGPGIDAEILPHIFEPFITSKHTGTGLGLTITHDIIQQHHGRIQAKNIPDGGAISSVWLPRH